MTFTEAAIEVLRREGKPLHFRKLTEIAVRESLLDHVGKIPEETMADQLAAHCRLPHAERRLIPVQQGTFALGEWGLDEDPQGLEGLIEPPADEELPYRRARAPPHPARASWSRATARGERTAPAAGRRRNGAAGASRRPRRSRTRSSPAPGRALALAEIATQGAERLLMPDAFVRDAGSLARRAPEDNRRRESAGRKPLFALDGDAVTLVAQPEPGERPASRRRRAPPPPTSASELRRAAPRGAATPAARVRRRRPSSTSRRACSRSWASARSRSRSAAASTSCYTARRKMGLADLRHGYPGRCAPAPRRRAATLRSSGAISATTARRLASC